MSKNLIKKENPENMPFVGEKDLKRIGKKHDARFGDIVWYKNEKTGRKVMCKEKASGDKKQFNADIEMARARMKIENPNLLKMLGWGTVTKKELCSTHHYVRMFFDYPESDLRNESTQRKKAGTDLTGDELNNATNSALHGLDYIHSGGLAHGDIRPELISAEKVGPTQTPNQFRVLDRLADPAPIPRAQANNMLNNKELYMSPQLWKHINTKGKKKPAFNKQKNDLFSLGMSVMGAGNKSSMKDVYKKGGAMDTAKLQNHLNKFNQKYANNPQLVNTVNHLVNVDEAARPDTKQLLHGKVAPVNVNSSLPLQEEEIIEFGQREETMVNSAPRQETVVQNTPPPQMKRNFAKKVQNTPPPVTETQVEGDDFFNNPTPMYQQYNPQTNYVRAEAPTYVAPQPVTYVETAPTYVAPQTRTETYVQSTPTYVSSQPRIETYVQSTPTYVAPQTRTEVKSSSNMPVTNTTSTVVTGEANVTYGKPKVVGSYIDHSSRRSFRGNDNTSTTVVKNTPSTTQYESETYVQSTPQTTTYVQSTPHTTTYVESVPSNTYVQFTPHTTTYVQSTPQTTTYVEPNYRGTTVYNTEPQTETYVQSSHNPTSTVVQSNPDVQYVVEKKKSTVFHDAQFGDIQENGDSERVYYGDNQPRRETRTVIVRNAEGDIIEEREEPIYQ